MGSIAVQRSFALPGKADIVSRLATSPPLEDLLTADDLEKQHENGQVPLKSAAVLHPTYKTPAVALIVQAIWTCVLCLSGTYGQLLNFVIFAAVVFYAVTAVGLFRLRQRVHPLPCWPLRVRLRRSPPAPRRPIPRLRN